MAMSAAVQVDQELIPGTDFVISVVLQDSAGNARTLVGATATSQMRSTPEGASTLWDVSEADAIALGGAAGTITMTIPATTTADISTAGWYDIRVVFAGGDIEVPVRGRVKYVPRVTR